MRAAGGRRECEPREKDAKRKRMEGGRESASDGVREGEGGSGGQRSLGSPFSKARERPLSLSLSLSHTLVLTLSLLVW